jgi:hypothetical protein
MWKKLIDAILKPKTKPLPQINGNEKPTAFIIKSKKTQKQRQTNK